MAWLDDHPPRIRQFRCPRRERPSGIIGVHTAESIADETGLDTGAENVADFIRRRTNYGSYHLLADSDSIIQLVEFRCVAYHIGTHGLNEHTIGISAATQAAKWNSLGDDYVDAMVRNMARAAARAARWLHEHYSITVPARRISLTQALRGERGFLAHGDADPDRRTDPGSTFPWGQFLNDYAAIMRGDDPQEDDMDLSDKIDLVNERTGERWWAGRILDANDITVGGALAYAAANLVSTKRYAEADSARDARMLKELAMIRAAVNGQPVNVAALASELAPLLVTPIVAELGEQDGATPDEVEARVERVLRRVLGTLDEE